MSWSYWLNDGEYRSDGEALPDFLENSAKSYAERNHYRDYLWVHKLEIVFECGRDKYVLSLADAKKLIDEVNGKLRPDNYSLQPIYQPVAGQPLYKVL